MQLLRLHQSEDSRIKDWIDRKTNEYVSHEIQNEILKVMAFSHLRKKQMILHHLLTLVLCVMNAQILQTDINMY